MDTRYWKAMGAGLMCLAMAVSVRAEEWRVKDAAIRFTFEVTGAPTHPSAGFFITIPDGGILPRPFPSTQAFDETGTALKSAILWHNSGSSAAVVCEGPKSGQTITIYVSGAPHLNVWTPESGLTPSALLCTYPGHGSRADAARLNALGQVDKTVHVRNQPGSKGATLALPGDRSGHPGSCAMYMLAYVDTSADPGSTWVAPMSFSGQMEVTIDGRQIRPAKKSDKQGGTGDAVNLSAGLHRLEILGYNAGGGATGPLLLTWRTPKTSAGELGGVRPSDLRYPGTPMWDARQLRHNEIVRSGTAVIRDAQARDGGPVAIYSLGPEHVYWFAGESPVLEYKLRALTGTNPAETKYSWKFSSDPGAVARGRTLPWLFQGFQDQSLTLVAEAGDKQSQCTYPLYPFTDQGSSMNDPNTRIAFREACLSMLQAYPRDVDPLVHWDAAMWNNLFRSLELTGNDPLVEHLVTVRWEALRKKVTSDRKELVEDLFLLETAGRDPKRAIKWASEFANASANRTRSVMMQLKVAEIMMYYLKDYEGARKVIKPLLLENDDAGEWARIRMGDLEFLQKNLNEATQMYGDVQNRSKHGKPGEETGVRRLHGPTLSGPVRAADFARKKAAEMAPPRKSDDLEAPVGVANWKLGAIRDVAASEEIRNLMDQGYYLEAFQALRRWEREFPLSKLSSDFILQEGKFYAALGDYQRARVVLEAYCDQVDASNFVPESLKLVVRCMIELREPEAEIAKYEKAIAKRMEFRSDE